MSLAMIELEGGPQADNGAHALQQYTRSLSGNATFALGISPERAGVAASRP